MSFETDITGGVKFFDYNYFGYKYGGRANATTNTEGAKYVLDINKYTRWVSVASNDMTTETLTLTSPRTVTVDKIIGSRHNFKEFTITHSGGTDFTNVNGLNADLVGGISETAFSLNTFYYSFDPVDITSIEINVTKTQVANEDKFLGQFFATQELGKFAGFPTISRVEHDKDIKVLRTISGRPIVRKGFETFSCNMSFRTYPVANDIALVESIHEREQSFLVWLCGGRYGTDYFKFEQRGWRLEDVYNVQHIRPLIADYDSGIYVNGANTSLNLIEVV